MVMGRRNDDKCDNKEQDNMIIMSLMTMMAIIMIIIPFRYVQVYIYQY